MTGEWQKSYKDTKYPYNTEYYKGIEPIAIASL